MHVLMYNMLTIFYFIKLYYVIKDFWGGKEHSV